MANELRRHKRADTIKWIVVFLLLLAAIAAIVMLAVKLNRQTTVERIGAEAYSIGALDEAGAESESEASIYTAKGFTVDGLKVTVADKAEVTYVLYFYDAEGEFISATESLSEDFDGTIPENAESAKIVVTPTADEDGKVSLTELFGYAGQVTVQVNR